MSDRRTFLRSLGAAALGSALPARAAALPSEPPLRRIDRPGIQLYTLRRAMAEDLEATLARVAEIGYREVEFAGYYDRTPEQVRTILDRLGLDSPATHVSLQEVRDGLERTMASARTIGHRYVIVPSLPSELRTAAGYAEFATQLNRAGEMAARAGIVIGYHNHDIDFVTVGGRIPFATLIERTDPALVTFELDLYWISKAGFDPIEFIDAHPGRFATVHVKDMADSADREMVDPGTGTIDFPGVLARRERAGIRHWFVEHDRPADPWATARAGFAYLKHLTTG